MSSLKAKDQACRLEFGGMKKLAWLLGLAAVAALLARNLAPPPLRSLPVPRLLALVQAPALSVGAWTRDDCFGITQQWSYVEDPQGQVWCWKGRDRQPLAPLPAPEYLEYVDPQKMVLFYVDKHNQYHRWEPDGSGHYHQVPIPRTQHHGSMISRPGEAEGRSTIFTLNAEWSRELKSTNKTIRQVPVRAETLALQPGAERWLALATESGALLLDTENLEVRHRLALGEIETVGFSPSGQRLAVFSADGKIRVYSVQSEQMPQHPLLEPLWQGAPQLSSPQAFDQAVRDYERATGKVWWD